MTSEKLPILLKRFAVASKGHCAAMEEMNAEQSGQQGMVIARLFEGIVREGEAGREGLLSLVDSENNAVAGMAAVYSMHYCPARCIPVLRRLASEPGLLGFRARIALDNWEAGEWLIE